MEGEGPPSDAHFRAILLLKNAINQKILLQLRQMCLAGKHFEPSFWRSTTSMEAESEFRMQNADAHTIVVHPLAGGIPVERAWQILRRYAEEVHHPAKGTGPTGSGAPARR